LNSIHLKFHNGHTRLIDAINIGQAWCKFELLDEIIEEVLPRHEGGKHADSVNIRRGEVHFQHVGAKHEEVDLVPGFRLLHLVGVVDPLHVLSQMRAPVLGSLFN